MSPSTFRQGSFVVVQVTRELEVAQEKMVAKEETLKKREAELTSAKVSISVKC